jgi:hypothetical protein
MLEMNYHVSIDVEVRMTEILVYALSALRLCSWSGSAWLDNLSLSSSAYPKSMKNIDDTLPLRKCGIEILRGRLGVRPKRRGQRSDVGSYPLNFVLGL